MPILKLVSVAKALAHAGMDPQSALGHSAIQRSSSHWRLATPVPDAGAALKTSRFFRSIDEHVDDDDKRGAFAMLLNAIERAAGVPNYQEVLKGSNIVVKVAHDFKYLNKVHKLWELKANKKDRLYFFVLTSYEGTKEHHLIVLLLAHHKKDQTTPREVSGHCETVMRIYLDPQAYIEIKE